jgi:ABC-2 type transport system ATP-binding protein
MTVLYTTHYMEEAQELSHRVGIIDHGEIIALGTQDELTQLVGEHDTLLLNVPEVPDETLAALRDLPEVAQCLKTGDDGDLRLLARDGRAALPDVIRLINTAGLSLQSVEIQEPTLEAVFLHLTGRGLRD